MLLCWWLWLVYLIFKSAIIILYNIKKKSNVSKLLNGTVCAQWLHMSLMASNSVPLCDYRKTFLLSATVCSCGRAGRGRGLNVAYRALAPREHPGNSHNCSGEGPRTMVYKYSAKNNLKSRKPPQRPPRWCKWHSFSWTIMRNRSTSLEVSRNVRHLKDIPTKTRISVNSHYIRKHNRWHHDTIAVSLCFSLISQSSLHSCYRRHDILSPCQCLCFYCCLRCRQTPVLYSEGRKIIFFWSMLKHKPHPWDHFI